MSFKETIFSATAILLLSITFASCKPKATEAPQSAPTSKATVRTSRQADMSRANGRVNEISMEQFTSLIVEDNPAQLIFNSPVPVVIDFYATWCGPCKKLAPYIEQLAEKYKGKVAFYHVDVDAQPDFARNLGIEAMPTLLFAYKENGWSQVGYMEKEQLEDMIERMLSMDK